MYQLLSYPGPELSPNTQPPQASSTSPLGTHCHGLFSPQLPRGFLVLGTGLSGAIIFEILELTSELLHSVSQLSQVL